MDFDTRYRNLNDAQRQAVDRIDGPLMVIAGPGTGKTELLSMRTANILKKTDTLPQNILCLTFTESGADAMRRRLIDIVGVVGYRVPIHTFHGFAADIASRYRHYFNQGAELRVADNLQKHQIISNILESLSYDNPLKLTFGGAFTSIGDIQTAISEIKRSGLTVDELRAVLEANEIAITTTERLLRDALPTGRIAKSSLGPLAKCIAAISAINEPRPQQNIPQLSSVIASSLQDAIDAAEQHPRVTPPLTQWKNTWCTKDTNGNLILKSSSRLARLYALLPVYAAYQQIMSEAGLQDFDDLIIELIHILETQAELRYELQEQYLYLMVDEFQDTNLAQMRILDTLTNNPINEGKPNLMVVGDDDQAIFSFQGANVGNILTFAEKFSVADPVVLTENYRSPKIVLDAARQVITQGEERLESRLPGLVKELSANATPSSPTAELTHFATAGGEHAWIAASIADKLASGKAANEIAVIAKNHSDLEALLPHFRTRDIPVAYEKRENVLENESVRQLILLARGVLALHNQNLKEADIALAELLAHPAWHLDNQTLWNISLTAYKNDGLWVELIADMPETAQLHAWLLETARLIEQLPLELLLDRLIGHNQPDSDYVSPLKEYFFADINDPENASKYLEHLESLRAIREKLREHFANETNLNLESFIKFIDLHHATDSKITRIRTVGDQHAAANLLSAHGSKGLEFDTVYITNAIDSRWGARARSRSALISYPENLRLKQATNSSEERLRLFFVAMTRAKQSLYISYADSSDSGKSQLLADFLATSSELTEKNISEDTSTASLIASSEALWYQSVVDAPASTLQEVLASQLERYKLSATDFCAFLDVTKGGPRGFLLNNLLRFPSSMSPAASYGSAIHAVLQRAHVHIASGELPIPEEDLLQYFENELATYSLPANELNHFLSKGSDSLRAFLNKYYSSFRPTQRAELNFAGQEVVLGKAKLKGKLDLVDIDKPGKTITVTDYKTGSVFYDWGKGGPYDKLKSHHYSQQLLFYQLLIAHSRDYSSYEVADSIIQFVEPDKSGQLVSLSLPASPDAINRLESLIAIVWQHITDCYFPDTSMYEASVKGILAFEQDLLDRTA
jgi:DNA helicase-2/ATP-dependent DNA helicase PcrA